MTPMSRRSQRGEPPAALDPEEMAQHAGRAAHLLKTLGNEHRLMILCALSEGETSVRALNEQVPLSQSALSQHLAVLREDGLVQTRREAQTIYYSVVEGPALQVVRLVHNLYCCGVQH